MNLTVIRLTMRGLLGRRRAILLLILPAILLGLAGLTRWSSGGAPDASATLAGQFAMGTLLPLMCLLISTGVIGAEIDDGSIVYMLAKPIPRRTIVLSKMAVAVGSAFVFAVLPTIIAVEIAGDDGGRLALAFGLSTALAAVAYTALFVALSVATRNAVILGLLYALLWETVLGGYVPGIRAVSVRQWALSVGERTLGSHAAAWGVSAEVGIVTGVVMLIVATVAATFLAVRKLQTLRLVSVD
ncbi:ABC transporter permease subunit [Demequina lutea]|uniref:ABC-2 type transport system permease protein n=1 Tax=Demequina lutea TaxID=431489 RepID=A0A7Z0CJI2_9MICO|nr:ABC transporter permease subunit [Demequina lutea]NYI40770.1 ABC-2 type transport system permease protein [Demequina lutea]